jgi:hypothetical protein
VKPITLAILPGSPSWSGPGEIPIWPSTPSTSTSVHRAWSLKGTQALDVVMDGKNEELRSELPIGRLLALGDYKAKLVTNEHPTAYDSFQVSEFLFPDKTRR